MALTSVLLWRLVKFPGGDFTGVGGSCLTLTFLEPGACPLTIASAIVEAASDEVLFV